MRILALDTSTGPASIALAENGHIIASYEDNDSMRQSQRLVASADALVRANGGYPGIQAIAVTIGPGGFTGIRIALAAARGLALACDVPLLGITTLEAFAWQALHQQPEASQASPFVNAFRNQAYVQIFERTANGMKSLCEAQAIDLAATKEFVTPYPAAIRLGNIPAEMLGINNYHFHAAPHASYVAGYAALLLAENAPAAIASRPAEAHYIRPPDAKPQKPLLGA